MELKKEAFSGMVWVFVDYFLVKGVSFIGSLILARLLMPSDFGIIAMISIFITLGNIFLDSGLSSSLIRNFKNNTEDYSTVFFTNVIFGIGIYIFFYIAAPYIAVFFNQEILINVIRVYTLVFILTSFSSVQMSILIKQMKFKKITLLNLPSVVLSLTVGIVMALKDYGVWSIVFMYITNQLVLSIGLWVSANWYPKLIFSKNKFLYHYNYGYKLLLSSILNGTTTNLYNAVTGKFYSLNTTGNFERAFMLNNYPLMVLSQIIGKVTFPLLSSIQNEKERFIRVFKRLVPFTFFINAPLMMILSACSAPLILTLLGDKWSEAIPIFEILCFGGIFYTLQALNVNVLKAYGKTDYILKGEVFLKILMVFFSGIGLFIGFKYFLWSIVLNSFLTLLVNMFYCSKIISIPVREQIKLMLPIFILSLLTFFIIRLELYILDNYTSLKEIFKLSVSLIFGGSFYVFLSYIFKMSVLEEIVIVIKEKIFNK